MRVKYDLATGLRVRPTFEQTIGYVENDKDKIQLPDRRARFLRNSFALSQLDGEGMRTYHQQQLNLQKEQEKEAIMRRIALSGGLSHAELRAREDDEMSMVSARSNMDYMGSNPEEFFIGSPLQQEMPEPFQSALQRQRDQIELRRNATEEQARLNDITDLNVEMVIKRFNQQMENRHPIRQIPDTLRLEIEQKVMEQAEQKAMEQEDVNVGDVIKEDIPVDEEQEIEQKIYPIPPYVELLKNRKYNTQEVKSIARAHNIVLPTDRKLKKIQIVNEIYKQKNLPIPHPADIISRKTLDLFTDEDLLAIGKRYEIKFPQNVESLGKRRDYLKEKLKILKSK
jgi:hypothetical protein